MEVIAVYRVKQTNKVVRILSGASILCQVLIFASSKDMPKLPTITKERAIEITGEAYLFV